MYKGNFKELYDLFLCEFSRRYVNTTGARNGSLDKSPCRFFTLTQAIMHIRNILYDFISIKPIRVMLNHNRTIHLHHLNLWPTYTLPTICEKQ